MLVIAYYSRAFHTEVDNPILKMLLVMIRSVIQISLVIAWRSSLGIYFVVMLIKKSRVPGSKSFQKTRAFCKGECEKYAKKICKLN